MTKYSSPDVGYFLLNGVNLLGDTTTINFNKMAEVKDKTVLGVAWREHHYTGLKSAEITQDGFFDDAVTRSHEQLKTIGGTKVITLTPVGDVLGREAHGWAGAIQVGYERKNAVGELLGAQGKYRVSGQADDCKVLLPLSTVTADGNSDASSLDGAASSADGGVFYLQVTDLNLDGGTGLSVSIRDSANNIAFAALASSTFTAVTVEPGYQRLEVPSTIRRYVSVAWDFTGTPGGSATATLAVIFKRN